MKKKVILLFVLLLCFGTAGCWNSVELDKRAFVTAVGIDKGEKEDEIKLTVQILKPRTLGPLSEVGGGSGESSVWVHSATGKTVFDAARNFTNEVSRKLNWEQNRIIVFGQDFAKEGVNQVLDFFLRDHESRKRAWIMVSNTTASEIVGAQGILGKIPADVIGDLMLATRSTSTVPAIDVHQFSLHLIDEYEAPYASRIHITEKEGKPGAAMEGTAVFKEDKFIGWLDGTETRGLLWIIDEISSGVIVLETDEAGRQVSFEIISSDTELKPAVVEGQPVMNIAIDAICSVGDAEGDDDFSEYEILHQYELKIQKSIEDEIRACLALVQDEYGTDILGFSKAIHRKFPQQWKEYQENWEEVYRNLPVEVDAEVVVNYTGYISTLKPKE